jgi:hypothetical protein
LSDPIEKVALTPDIHMRGSLGVSSRLTAVRSAAHVVGGSALRPFLLHGSAVRDSRHLAPGQTVERMSACRNDGRGSIPESKVSMSAWLAIAAGVRVTE